MIKAASKSDKGKIRQKNDDSVFVDETKRIYFLADGMGGRKAGEVASSIAVKTAFSYMQEIVSGIFKEGDVDAILIEGIMKAHRAVRERAMSDVGCAGMGTTLIIMLINNGKAHVCHVGDSRAYLLQERLRRITRDHTVGEYLLDHGNMRREDIPHHQWNVLTQAVGSGDDLTPEYCKVELKDGDCILLCSDGLTDMLEDNEIEAIIRTHASNVRDAADELVHVANDKGGDDNISVIIVRYEES